MLEPIMNVTISVPEQFMGDIIGDLNSKRGRIMGVEQAGKRQVIQATGTVGRDVPLFDRSKIDYERAGQLHDGSSHITRRCLMSLPKR